MSEQNSEAKKSLTNGMPDPNPDPEDMLDIEVGKSVPASPAHEDKPALPVIAAETPNTTAGAASQTELVAAGPMAENTQPVESIASAETIVLTTTFPAVAQPAVASRSAADEADGWAGEYQPVPLPAEEAADSSAGAENWFALIVRETLETVVLAVVIFLLIRVAIQNYRIEGSSMEPNFHNGEYLLVNKLAYRLGEYQRGDVIVFKYPGDTTKDYIKRVIGLPGDVVEIRDGVLYVNEQMVNEPYATMPMNYLNEPARIVEAGTLYVMGDNRPASSDTRDWGLLDQDLVIGQAWLAIFPLDTFGLVDHPDLHFTPGMAQGP